MKRYFYLGTMLALILILALSGCGGGNSSNPSGAPTIPANLTATGSLGNIRLSWDASTGVGLVGYNVYRSVNESGPFTKLNSSPVASTSYDNAIESPAGDGVLYYYRVTAVGNLESAVSNIVKNMHGTRLEASYTGGFATEPANSPYVAEGTTVVDGGNFRVATDTKLYLMDNSAIDLEAGNSFVVSGLLRSVVSSGSVHATFTAHKTGGLADGDGFLLEITGAVNYDPNDDSGTLLRYVQISNLGSTGAAVNFCGIKLDNVKIDSNVGNGNCRFEIANNGWAIIQNCYFEKSLIRMTGNDLRTSPFKVTMNIFHGGYNSLYFSNLANPCVDPGQIELNTFNGSSSVMLYNVTGGSNIPLGHNYWNGGSGNPPVPDVSKVGTTSIDVDFNAPSAPLSSPPTGVGPNW